MNGLIATNADDFTPGFPGSLAEKYYMVPDGEYPYVHSGAPVMRGMGVPDLLYDARPAEEDDLLNTTLGLVIIASTGWIIWMLTR